MDRNDSMLEKNVWEFIAPYLADKTGRTYTQNKEYKESVKAADLIFDKLDDSLSDQQAELLEEYFCANNATVAIMERLVYQQGMRDMLVLLTSILKGGGENDN